MLRVLHVGINVKGPILVFPRTYSLYLARFRSAAENAGVADVRGFPDIYGHLLYLLRQLACGRKYERDGSVTATQTPLVGYVDQSWQDVL